MKKLLLLLNITSLHSAEKMNPAMNPAKEITRGTEKITERFDRLTQEAESQFFNSESRPLTPQPINQPASTPITLGQSVLTIKENDERCSVEITNIEKIKQPINSTFNASYEKDSSTLLIPFEYGSISINTHENRIDAYVTMKVVKEEMVENKRGTIVSKSISTQSFADTRTVKKSFDLIKIPAINYDAQEKKMSIIFDFIK